jgi:hypothetical protein
MGQKKQNPGWRAGASRNQLGGWLHPSLTALERQAQMLGCRFCLSPAMARDLARLCFGEAHND